VILLADGVLQERQTFFISFLSDSQKKAKFTPQCEIGTE